MKKIILLSTLLTSVAFSFAQIKIRPGIVAGANYSTFEGKGVDASGGAEYKFGYHAGISANIKFSDVVTVQPELLYSTNGASIEPDDEKVKINLSYINLPVKLKVVSKYGLYGMAGVEGGYLVNAKAKNEEGETAGIKAYSNNIRVGWFGGAGYQTKNGIGIDVRYVSDFTSFFKESKMKNAAIMASVFFHF